MKLRIKMATRLIGNWLPIVERCARQALGDLQLKNSVAGTRTGLRKLTCTTVSISISIQSRNRHGAKRQLRTLFNYMTSTLSKL